jgi:hypothetical protein
MKAVNTSGLAVSWRGWMRVWSISILRCKISLFDRTNYPDRLYFNGMVLLIWATLALAVVSQETDDPPAIGSAAPSEEPEYSDSWMIHVPAGEARAREIAEAAGFRWIRQVSL